MKRMPYVPSTVELSFHDRAAAIRWVADRMDGAGPRGMRVAELRAYADQLDAMADQMERALRLAAQLPTPAGHE